MLDGGADQVPEALVVGRRWIVKVGFDRRMVVPRIDAVVSAVVSVVQAVTAPVGVQGGGGCRSGAGCWAGSLCRALAGVRMMLPLLVIDITVADIMVVVIRRVIGAQPTIVVGAAAVGAAQIFAIKPATAVAQTALPRHRQQGITPGLRPRFPPVRS